MSLAPISRSPDLSRLRDEGYSLTIIGGFLVVGDVPYLDAQRSVQRGRLATSLALAGDVTINPIADHVAHFEGGMPHDAAGRPLHRIVHQPSPTQLTPDLRSDVSFSSKPAAGYADYHDQMTTYIGILEGEAQAVDPTATARTFRPIEADGDTPFLFVDTASSRAGIANYTAKLAVPSVAVIGLGGTGAYVLDMIAKTPIAEIHLFDGDHFLQHNAFRAPGCTDLDVLVLQPNKAEHWATVYGRMRRGIVPHAYHVEPARVAELDGMHTVFIAIDDGPAKRAIIDHLDTTDAIYIDVGMGLYHGEGGLAGTLRVTASAPGTRSVRQSIPMDPARGVDPYETNIQVAELNALNAALGVLRWKKRLGFYADLDAAALTTFDIDGTHIINEAA